MSVTHAMASEHTHFVCRMFDVGDCDASFACGDRLDGMEAEDGDV
jgi:hypothetical protein